MHLPEKLMNKKVFCLASMAAFAALSLGCAKTLPHPEHTEDISKLMEHPSTASDYLKLAEHFEEDAKSLKDKADAEKKNLDELKSKGYLFGKQAQDLAEHSEAKIHIYEQAAANCMMNAEKYRNLAKQMSH
jgi:hypothetical protein